MEWREIAIHFQQNVGIDKTIAVYKLLEINSSVQYWAVILGRWVKDLAKDDNDVKFKRTSVIDKRTLDFIEDGTSKVEYQLPK